MMSPYPIDHIPWGDLATWVTAFATCITGIITLGLIVIGFLQIQNERNARKKAEKGRAFEARRDQAEHIAAWMTTLESRDARGEAFVWIEVRNQSPQPVYQVIVNHVALQDDGTEYSFPRIERYACIDVAPPGDGYVKVLRLDTKRTGVEIAFQDIAGRYWLRKSYGELVELKDHPLKYYGIQHRPPKWERLKKEPEL